MEEEWKQISYYENYQVSNLGRIRVCANVTNQYHKKGEVYEPRYRIGKHAKNCGDISKDYYVIALYNNSGRKDMYLHRLVAQAFIPNPNNLPQVNHIDGNKHNNRVDNLEWCDNSHNQREAYRLDLRSAKVGEKHPRSKKINQYDLDGNFIKTWYCIADAEEYFNEKRRSGSISPCIKGITKSAYGYKWKEVV